MTCRRTLKKAFFALFCWICLCPLPGGASTLRGAGTPWGIVVEGLSGKERGNVEAVLTLPAGVMEDGKPDETLMQRFEGQIPKKVREALRPFGYYDPRITTLRKQTDDGLDLLVVRIDPGEPIRVETVRVRIDGDGGRNESLTQLAERFPLKSGDILRQDLYEQAKSELFKKAVALGYLEAAFSTHEIRLSRERLRADIDLVLKTGLRYRFGEASYTGTPGYPEDFLRRYLEFRPGDVFSYEQMARTQANYAGTDRFREITLFAEKEGAAADGRIPVKVALVPSPAKSVRVGAGYGTDTGPRASLRYRDMNLFHLGQDLETELKISQILQGVSTRYLLPGADDFRSYTGLSAGVQREDTASYVSTWGKLEVERARSFGRDKIGSIFVQARRENSEAGGQMTNTFLLMPGFRFSEMHYDDALRPRKGFQYQLEVRGSHQSFGSATGFLQFLSGGDLIVPLPADFAFITRARVGGTWQNDPSRDLPVSVRFFAGGDRSVRGYAYQSLGPRDAGGNVIGGRNLLAGSVEIERYIGNRWGVSAFYDAGNAFDNLADISAAQGSGMGLRYYSPIGPIKLDVARQLGVVQPDTRIHLTVGVGL